MDAEAKCKAEAEVWAEKMEMEQGNRLLSKQKGRQRVSCWPATTA